MKVIGTIGHVDHGKATVIARHNPEAVIFDKPHKTQETMREVAQLAEILAAQAQMHHDLIAYSTPAFMPSTGTPRKKHVNKLHCCRKAKKKHRRNAKNR